MVYIFEGIFSRYTYHYYEEISNLYKNKNI